MPVGQLRHEAGVDDSVVGAGHETHRRGHRPDPRRRLPREQAALHGLRVGLPRVLDGIRREQRRQRGVRPLRREGGDAAMVAHPATGALCSRARENEQLRHRPGPPDASSRRGRVRVERRPEPDDPGDPFRIHDPEAQRDDAAEGMTGNDGRLPKVEPIEGGDHRIGVVIGAVPAPGTIRPAEPEQVWDDEAPTVCQPVVRAIPEET